MPQIQSRPCDRSANGDCSQYLTQHLAGEASGNADGAAPTSATKSFKMPDEQRQLHDRLQVFEFDRQGAEMTFSKRLARDNMWSDEFSRRVCDEYRRFLFLAAITEQVVTPSEAVDEAWHLHLLYTKSYWIDLCGGVLGRPLHHIPSEGGNAQRDHYMDCYLTTLSAYEKAFAEKPPRDIWPDVAERFRQAGRRRNVSLDSHWVVRKPGAFVNILAGTVMMSLGWTDLGGDLHSLLPAATFMIGLGTMFWPFVTASDVGRTAALHATSGGCGGCSGCGGCGG